MKNTEKFTNKSALYSKYRPRYPEAAIRLLKASAETGSAAVVADVGAGTGILTKQLAGHVKKVYAVEPNRDMRAACQKYCHSEKNIEVVNGSAEQTTLADKSADLITVAQAFHWFDKEKTKHEFRRILKPHGKAALIWNSREENEPLIKEDRLLFERLCPNFTGFSGGSRFSEQAYDDFFKIGSRAYHVFPNDLIMTIDDYIGRNLSASYAPFKGDENYKYFIEGLTRLFNKYSRKGRLVFPQKTYLYIGEV